jgi:hypothetical protein
MFDKPKTPLTYHPLAGTIHSYDFTDDSEDGIGA